ncbi:hypothetical protein IQ07DRAFT_668895 [Pyrenochaeta sp. DS3sAY3a]|nr:hypothetical protein IQ07DRAFT_668895 [Pyrenochaeta sp. DS3sAY3a]
MNNINHSPQKNVYEATLSQPLDFSFFHPFTGNSGQSNYAAGCGYQVALAKHRITPGFPATAIDLGIVGGVRYVVEKESGKRIKMQEFKYINKAEILVLIELGILQPMTGHLVTGLDSYLDIATMEKEGNMPLFAKDLVLSHFNYLRISRPRIQCSLQKTGQRQLPSRWPLNSPPRHPPSRRNIIS